MQGTLSWGQPQREREAGGPPGWSYHHSKAQNGWQEMTVTFSGKL